jgi:lysophospholipid acyltransferase (LPLAT)-like uncharacterized protein
MFRRLKYAIMLNLLPPVAYFFLLVLRATIRIEHRNREAADLLLKKNDGLLLCFWHNRLLSMPFAYDWKRVKVKVLISLHRDGEFIARIIEYFGVGTVRGSQTRGAVQSVRTILSELKSGTTVAITPDGPKGPRYHIKQGVIEMARIAQKPIVPVTYGATRKRVFSSWDRFVLPYPFARIIFLWGDPLYVPRDLDGQGTEALRIEVEKALITLTETADNATCGR